MVFTVHEEKGLANISGLLAILEHIKPEIIFLEIPSAALDDYSSGNRQNLESTAVSRYRENHRVDLVPVDLPTPEAHFFASSEELYERIERESPEYCRLVDRHSQAVRDKGFAYLNSEQCSTPFSALDEAVHTRIEELADHRLAELYESWKRQNQLRDEAMMERIESYCRQVSFANAAFLVGAAHRQSIVDLSRSEPRGASSAIQWDFAAGGGITGA